MSPACLRAGLAIVSSSAVASPALAAADHLPFEEAAMFVEQNATDGDTEVVITGVAGDDGLSLLRIRAPDGRLVARLASPDPTTLGMREFHFESPEPPGEAVLAAYPEGRYVLYGESTAGETFRSVLRLSHQLPPAVTILHPANEAEVPDEALIIRWSPAAGIQGYVIEVENESGEVERALTMDLSPQATSFRVPNVFIVPGGEYQIGVHSVHNNGNIVVVETTFTVEE